MKNLSKKIAYDYIEKEKWLLIILIALFTFFLVYPFTQYDTEIALQIIILGAVRSSLFMILAMGFSLIFGVAKQLKLSLGGYYVLGAYLMYYLLETVKITLTRDLIFLPIHSLSGTKDPLKNMDELFLLSLVLLPIILIIVLLAYFWTIFSTREFILILASLIIAVTSVTYFGETADLYLIQQYVGFTVESFYVGLTVLAICLAIWYLELPKEAIALSTFLLGISVPILLIVKLPVIFISLAALVILFIALLAMAIDRYLLDEFRASHVNTMIITFSMALIFQSIIQVAFFPEKGKRFAQFGPEDRSLKSIIPEENIKFFGALVPNIKVIALIFSILICILLYSFVWFSKMGMALRAVAQDEEAAALAGIDIRKAFATVSGIGMGLVAFAAIFTSRYTATPTWSPFMGWWILIWAIAVVTLGGMGSLPGSIIAAIIIGYSEIMISMTEGFQNYSVVVPLLVVLIVLIFKPEGLFGEKKELEG